METSKKDETMRGEDGDRSHGIYPPAQKRGPVRGDRTEPVRAVRAGAAIDREWREATSEEQGPEVESGEYARDPVDSCGIVTPVLEWP